MKETINSINVAILLSANALCWVIRIPMVLAVIMIFCVVLHWVTNRQFAYKNTLGLYLYCMLFFLFPLLLSINSIGNNINDSNMSNENQTKQNTINLDQNISDQNTLPKKQVDKKTNIKRR